jgi:anti-sigma regulatory factor (Ser/Thr protein kinase)
MVSTPGPSTSTVAAGHTTASPLKPQLYPQGAVVRATLTIPARPEHVATARRFVIATLGDDHPQAHTATLLTSELVTNSLQHSASSHDGAILAVGASRAAHWLRVEVVDDGAPTLPTLREADPDAERGRGLTLVDSLATRWGTQRGDTGTTTWFEIAS